MTLDEAKIVVSQLGGNKFIAMTGASCFYDGGALIIRFKGSRKANIMIIRLNSLDLYDVRICKVEGCIIKPVREASGVYNDMLIPIFESTTGLNTSL